MRRVSRRSSSRLTRDLVRGKVLWLAPFLLACSCVLVWFSAKGFLLGGAPYGDDHSAHLALCKHLATLMREGDHDWFWEQTNLGLPLFASYQPLPSMVTASLMLGLSFLPEELVFKGVVVGLWSTMPIAWFVGARWLGVSRARALVMALMVLFTREQWHNGLSLTSTSHTGLFTQAWGLWLLPIGVGSVQRAVINEDLPRPWACLLMSLLVMSHLFMGLLASLASVCLLFSQWGHWRRRMVRLVQVAAGAFLIAGFWLVPLLLARPYLGGLPWMNDEYDGWPPTLVVKSLMGGALLDATRFPWLTILAGAGFFIALLSHRRSWHFRAASLFALMGVGLIGGRQVWSEAYLALPMHANVNPTRYVVAVQIAALASACSCLVWSFERLQSKRWCRGLSLVTAAVLLLLAGKEQHRFMGQTLRAAEPGESALRHVAGHLADFPTQRFMVDSKYGTGSHFHRDRLAMLSGRPQLQSYALGYHATTSTYYAEHMKIDRASLRLFNVTSLVARNDVLPPPPFERHRVLGKYTLYRVKGAERWGYFDVVWPGPRVKGSLRALRRPLSRVAPSMFSHRMVAFIERNDGQEVVVPDAPESPKREPGAVLTTKASALQFDATVRAAPGAWLLFKMTYFPYWHAEVNGKAVQVHHVAPNFMAVALPEGVHRVRFRYKNPPAQKVAAVVCGIVATFAWLLPACGRRRRRRVV